MAHIISGSHQCNLIVFYPPFLSSLQVRVAGTGRSTATIGADQTLPSYMKLVTTLDSATRVKGRRNTEMGYVVEQLVACIRMQKMANRTCLVSSHPAMPMLVLLNSLLSPAPFRNNDSKLPHDRLE